MDTLNVLLGLIIFLPDPSFTYYTKYFGDHETCNPEHLEERNTTINIELVADELNSATRKLKKCVDLKKNDQKTVGTVGERKCSHSYATAECMDGLLDEFSPYFKKGEEEKIKQIYYNSQLELNDFMCNGKENWYDSFIQNGGLPCITRNKDLIQQCVIIDTLNLISELRDHSIGESRYSVEEIFCRIFMTNRKCTGEYMSTCESKKAVSLHRELMDVQKNLKACGGEGLMSGSAAAISRLP